MEILILVLLYYLSQNPNFADSVKPLMAKLKDSEEMLRFLKDLSNFSRAFTPSQDTKNEEPCKAKKEEPCKVKKESSQTCEDKEKTSASPTAGIADEFIQNILENYFKQH